MTCKARVTADCFCHCPGSVCLYMTLCDSLCLNMTLCDSLWFSVTQYTFVWLFMILRYPLWLQPTANINWYSAIGTQQLLQDEMDWIDEVCYTLLDGVKSVSCQLRATERFWDWPGTGLGSVWNASYVWLVLYTALCMEQTKIVKSGKVTKMLLNSCCFAWVGWCFMYIFL